MDKTIQQGYTPEYVAEEVLRAVVNETKEIMVAPFVPKAATFIRYFLPSLYFKIMERRAKAKSE